MDILTIDFETFYDRAFSLSKITTEAYIRDAQFEVVGVGVQINDGEPQWFSGTKTQTKKFLDQFAWGDSIALAHNAMFDMAILNWVFDIRPKRIADTLSMARALHGTEVGGSLKALAEHYNLGAKGTEVLNALGMRRIDFDSESLARYGEYCKNDVALTYGLFAQLVRGFPVTELRLIDVTIRMFTEPTLQLDKKILENHLANIQKLKAALIGAVGGDRETLMSNPKFAERLRSCGVEPPMKISPTTGKETYAFSKTDEEFKALLEHKDLRVQALVTARLGAKSTIEETRTQRFIDIATRGTLPIPLRYYAAHTGRWGGDDKVNMQNLPRGSLLKTAMCAPEGYLVIDSDSSQIEARTLAWLAGQNDLVDAFERGEDVYKIMASSIYGKPQEEITKDERFVGKTTILGCFGADTRVLTDSGWRRIIDVKTTDMVWDGEEWVAHQGVVPKGVRETITAYGVDATPEHEILTEHGWREWHEVVTNPSLFQSALSRANSPSLTGHNTQKELGALRGGTQSSGALAVGKGKLIGTTSKHSEPRGVIHALKAQATRLAKSIGGTKIFSQIWGIGSACLIGLRVVFQGVTQPLVRHTPIMGGEGSLCMNRGVRTGERFYDISLPSKGGTTQAETSTVLTTAGGMNLITCDSQHEQKTHGISAQQGQCKKKLMTYDIAYAGPRNRFTIATDAGVLIVHNCGYGMGANKFRAQLKTFGVDLPQEECERIIWVYRETYPRIPKLWREAHTALNAIMNNQTSPLGREGVLSVEGNKGIRLPNRLYIKYPNLRQIINSEDTLEMVYDTKRGRSTVSNRIYGGKVVENLCQAIARIVIGEQLLLINKKFRVVMTVHDAIACIVPESEVETGREFVEMAMRIRPSWAPDLPLNCESGFGKSYGEC